VPTFDVLGCCADFCSGACTQLARLLGVRVGFVKLRYAKVAEMQRRGVVHFHLVVRLDGAHPDLPGLILPPPPGLGVDQLRDAITAAATATGFTTRPHPANPVGWRVGWDEQLDIRPIKLTSDGELSDQAAAGYLAKYATKSTEQTGHISRPITTEEAVHRYANPTGNHPERLVHACWTLGVHRDWHGLRRWAHMLGYGGHFLTKARHYSLTFRELRNRRVRWRRTQLADQHDHDQEIALTVSWLAYAGAGWKTTGDALLANTAAARAREQRQAAREALTTT
jgi:replication initiator protein RepSA